MVTNQNNALQERKTGTGRHQKMFMMLVAGFALLATCTVVDARTITCESGGGTQFCPADTRGGVQLTRQLSKAGCYEGKTWGYDRNGIWVTRGCRARFETEDFRPEYYGGGYGDREYRPREDHRRGGPPRTITCESHEPNDNYCRAPLRHAQVEIVRQLSKKPCNFGETWGWDGGGIWVTRGCRAVFSID